MPAAIIDYLTARRHAIKAAREAAGHTQETLSAAIGVTRNTIQTWESSGRLPRAETIIAAAEELGLSVDQVLGREPLSGLSDDPGPLPTLPMPQAPTPPVARNGAPRESEEEAGQPPPALPGQRDEPKRPRPRARAAKKKGGA